MTYRIAVCDYLNGEVESAGETAMEILQKSPNSVEAVNCHMLLGIISHADKDEPGRVESPFVLLRACTSDG
ncbi:MAG: hypothetical protein U5N86_05770 [Planctomycetota bacterium]|nr:hypothetical protein [Planctomycetota bacterium]